MIEIEILKFLIAIAALAGNGLAYFWGKITIYEYFVMLFLILIWVK